MERAGRVVYLAYSGLTQHSGERLCHLNRLRALGAAEVPCAVIVMELADRLGSAGLAARVAEAQQVYPAATILTQQRSARRINPEVLATVARGPVSAILFTQSQAALAVRGLKRRFRAPAIWDCRGFASERVAARRSLARRAKDVFVEYSERVAARVADHTLCVSEAMREELGSRVQLLAAAITVIPNGTSVERFRPDPEARLATRKALGLEGTFVLAFSGSVAAWQCLRETGDFVAEVATRLPSAHLLVLSTEPEKARAALAESRLAKERTTVTTVPHEAMPRSLAAADAACLLRRNTPGQDIASPMKFAEYLACGLPVIIGPAVGDYTGWVREERLGVVVDPARPEEWPGAAAELSELVKDPELAARCRRVACERLDLAQHAGLLMRAMAAAAERAR
jgi:glycosyltransferase involved in cell wall biosynthesis